jgi:hypothetical protein
MNAMTPEGVIRFCVECETGKACDASEIEDLETWRAELQKRGWLGHDPCRYGGLGFGNLSKRLADGTFLITGSQTSRLPKLTPTEYAKIIEFNLERNWVRAVGLTKPSSEVLTHLAIYGSLSTAMYVFHTHIPEIWNRRHELNIPATNAKVQCGTIEMFREVERLLQDRTVSQLGILAMGGHQDGIMTWAQTADGAGTTLLQFVAPRRNI